MQAQFVAVSRDKQQRVVGTGTEDEHREDARDRAIERDARGVRHQASRDARDEVGDTDHGKRNDPQHGTAVGDDEQQGNNECRHTEQHEVGTLEHRRDVDQEAFGTREPHLNAVGQAVRSNRANLVGALRLHAHAVFNRERKHHERRRAIVRNGGRRHEAIERDVGQLDRALGDRGDVVVAQLTALAAKDEQTARGVVVGKLLLQRGGLNRLR